MTARSPLWGRRIHIAGSIDKDPSIASAKDAKEARALVSGLVEQLVKRGANFVVPVDAEKLRGDKQPICFDWTVWTAIADSLALRPADAPSPLAVAVQHYKTEEQVPEAFASLWDKLKKGSLVRIENAAQWNMAAKRMDVAARSGDILIALGGSEGVLYLADLYHAAGKPVVPLKLALSPETSGARRLFDFGLNSSQTQRLFRTVDGDPHSWLNRIQFPAREPMRERIDRLVALLEALEPPHAFVVRLLNEKVAEFEAVEEHFETVVKPVIEGELGYRMIVVDGEQAFEHARVDEEIFAKLHRSSIVLADLTGSRPNCFIELGYALGRGLPTMVMAKDGTDLPFDIKTLSGLIWKDKGDLKLRRDAFRVHWNAIRARPPLVVSEPLIA